MVRVIDKMLAPIRRKLALMVTRGVVELIDDSKGLQTLQITGLDGEVLDNVERIQQYGFTSRPHKKSDCLFLNVGASRSHPIVIAVDDRRYRLELDKDGEAAMYDDQGQKIVMTRSGIVITSPKGTTHNGDMSINGDVVINGRLTLNGVVVNTHNHTGDSGGTTGAMQ